MPDADDFDIDYFRALLGGGEKKAPAAQPLAKPRPPGASGKPEKSARALSRKKGASASRRKKP